MRLVLGEGLPLAGTGVGLGSLGAIGLTRTLGTMLYEVSPTIQLFSSGPIVGGVSRATSYLPARRVMRVDPAVALDEVTFRGRCPGFSEQDRSRARKEIAHGLFQMPEPPAAETENVHLFPVPGPARSSLATHAIAGHHDARALGAAPSSGRRPVSGFARSSCRNCAI